MIDLQHWPRVLRTRCFLDDIPGQKDCVSNIDEIGYLAVGTSPKLSRPPQCAVDVAALYESAEALLGPRQRWHLCFNHNVPLFTVLRCPQAVRGDDGSRVIRGRERSPLDPFMTRCLYHLGDREEPGERRVVQELVFRTPVGSPPTYPVPYNNISRYPPAERLLWPWAGQRRLSAFRVCDIIGSVRTPYDVD